MKTPTLKQIFSLALWPYVVVALLSGVLIKSSTAHTNRLNFLKGTEDDIRIFIEGKKPFNRDDFLWAIRYYDELAKTFPNNDIITANKGFCYFYLGEYQKAAAAYEEAIRLKPYIYTHYWDRGMVAWRMHDAEGVVNFWAMSLKVLPKTKTVYENIGRALQKNSNGFYMLAMAVNQMPQDQQVAAQRLLTLRDQGLNAVGQEETSNMRLHFHSQFMIMLSAKMSSN